MDISKVISGLKKKYGYSSIGLAGDRVDPSEFVSTGNKAFDLMSDGGVPFGHIAEFLGLSASGKSTFIYKLMANAQRDYNAVCVLVDRENAYTNSRARQLGIDPDNNFVICPPADCILASDGMGFLINFITSVRESEDRQRKKGEEVDPAYIVLAIDSVGAFASDTAIDKSQAPRTAKDLHTSFRKIIPLIDNRVMLVFSNHITYKVGIIYGNTTSSTGGEAPKYYSHERFALEDRKKILDATKGNEVVGNWLGVEAIKTRLGACYRTCYVRHLYKTGIDYYSGYARLLADRGYLEPKNKSEFKSFKQKTLSFGEKTVNEDNIDTFLAENPELDFDTYPEYAEKPVGELAEIEDTE